MLKKKHWAMEKLPKRIARRYAAWHLGKKKINQQRMNMRYMEGVFF